MTYVTDFTTPDLSDEHAKAVALRYQFHRFGSREKFAGPISTVACFEDNSKVAEAVGEPGDGKVLLVDGRGSLDRSLLGDNLARKASDHGWAGLVIIGAIRDVEVIDDIDIGVFAMGVIPVKTQKLDRGDRDVALCLKEIWISPGQWLYADRNGVLVSREPIH